jgi:hypothetical protein
MGLVVVCKRDSYFPQIYGGKGSTITDTTLLTCFLPQCTNC